MSDANIYWDLVPNQGFTLDNVGNPIKTDYVPSQTTIIDRYGSEFVRFTSPVKYNPYTNVLFV